MYKERDARMTKRQNVNYSGRGREKETERGRSACEEIGGRR